MNAYRVIVCVTSSSAHLVALISSALNPQPRAGTTPGYGFPYATEVIVGPPKPSSKTASQVVAFNGTGDKSKTVGQIPASYTQGAGTILSGTTANKATEAALLTYPGGVVDRVVQVSRAEYEVHNIGVSWPHHIFVSNDFKVVGAND